MATEATAPRLDRLAGYSPANLGLVGQLATSWGMAGGLLAAAVVWALMVAGDVSASVGFLTTTMFFVAGSLVGFLHGGILGYWGRPDDVSRILALRRLGLATLYAVPAMAVGWCLAMALTLGAVGVVGGRPALLIFAVVGGTGLAITVIWAIVEGHRAIDHLSRRWPGTRAVLTLLGMAFLALLPFFLVVRPEVWWIGVRPKPTLAVLMAATATLWIGGPLITVAFLAVRAWRKRPSK